MTRTALHVPVLLSASLAEFCQAPSAPPAFEVASIKPTMAPGVLKDGSAKMSITSDPGRITYSNADLRDCIKVAYGVKDYQISSAERLSSERYDITAAIPPGAAPDQAPAMLRTLLAERFHLSLHRENKEMPVYALAPGRNGPKLHPAEGAGPAKQEFALTGMVFRNTSMAALDEFLSKLPAIERPVVDMTGLKGVYDFAVNSEAAPPGASIGDQKRALGEWLRGTAIFADLQEQLGLRLEARKSAFEMLVIDRAGKPSGN